MTPEPTTMTTIDADEARQLVIAGAALLDVREDNEWQAGHAPEAVHLAMGLVGDRIEEVPTDRIVVCICRVGGRSGSVANALAGAGYEVRNLDGGMLAWELAGFPVVTDEGAVGRVI